MIAGEQRIRGRVHGAGVDARPVGYRRFLPVRPGLRLGRVAPPRQRRPRDVEDAQQAPSHLALHRHHARLPLLLCSVLRAEPRTHVHGPDGPQDRSQHRK